MFFYLHRCDDIIPVWGIWCAYPAPWNRSASYRVSWHAQRVVNFRTPSQPRPPTPRPVLPVATPRPATRGTAATTAITVEPAAAAAAAARL